MGVAQHVGARDHSQQRRPGAFTLSGLSDAPAPKLPFSRHVSLPALILLVHHVLFSCSGPAHAVLVGGHDAHRRAAHLLARLCHLLVCALTSPLLPPQPHHVLRARYTAPHTTQHTCIYAVLYSILIHVFALIILLGVGVNRVDRFGARSVSVATCFVTVRVALWLLAATMGLLFGTSLSIAWAIVTNIAMRVRSLHEYLTVQIAIRTTSLFEIHECGGAVVSGRTRPRERRDSGGHRSRRHTVHTAHHTVHEPEQLAARRAHLLRREVLYSTATLYTADSHSQADNFVFARTSVDVLVHS